MNKDFPKVTKQWKKRDNEQVVEILNIIILGRIEDILFS